MTVEAKNTYTESQTSPLASLLAKRISGWRKEIQLKSCPDPKRLNAVMRQAATVGVDPSLFAYIVGGCEWYYRVCSPVSVVLRKKIKSRLENANYNPFGFGQFPVHAMEELGDLPVLDRYVDKRLCELWDSERPEMSRFMLKSDLERLVKKLEQPFFVPTFESAPKRHGGYQSPVAPWVAATIVYAFARKTRPCKNDSSAIDVAYELLAVLKGGTVDNSLFHRKRRQIIEKLPQLPASFLDGLQNVTQGHGISIEKMFEGAMWPGVAWYWLPHKGVQLFASKKGESKTLAQREQKSSIF